MLVWVWDSKVHISSAAFVGEDNASQSLTLLLLLLPLS
jgi:hypothetical protein